MDEQRELPVIFSTRAGAEAYGRRVAPIVLDCPTKDLESSNDYLITPESLPTTVPFEISTLLDKAVQSVREHGISVKVTLTIAAGTVS